MREKKVGISDIQIYLPAPKMELSTLVEHRVREVPKLERHLERACRSTGQRAIRFPSVWEDTSTLAASAAYKLIRNNPNLDPADIRYLTVGTESGLDHSKPVSSFVEGMLQNAGIGITDSLSSFQVQHACAGGTLALLSVSALLQVSGRDDESGIVMCSDIARYKPHTTAEVTQGAGSVAMLVENNPKLIELDLTSQGYCSRDVDDFFRPLGSKTAQVKGTYSMQCYRDTLESAFADHCDRIGGTPEEVLKSTDLFVLHAPFRNLPETAMTNLLAKHLGLDGDDATEFLEKKGLYDGIDVVADVGNIYTGAMYLTLAFQLHNQYQKIGRRIVGKRILLASYGSGNTMTVISGRIAEGAPAVIAGWDMDAVLNGSREASFTEYQQWVGGPYAPTGLNHTPAHPDGDTPLFTLETIRDDGYREYAFHPEAEQKLTNVKVPVEVYQTA
jgi:hydroxymethylglutaryl-CoA synthase